MARSKQTKLTANDELPNSEAPPRTGFIITLVCGLLAIAVIAGLFTQGLLPGASSTSSPTASIKGKTASD